MAAADFEGFKKPSLGGQLSRSQGILLRSGLNLNTQQIWIVKVDRFAVRTRDS
jgi:hypothetical protein